MSRPPKPPERIVVFTVEVAPEGEPVLRKLRAPFPGTVRLPVLGHVGPDGIVIYARLEAPHAST